MLSTFSFCEISQREKFAWTKLHGFCAIFDVRFWVDNFDLMVANGCWPRSVSSRRGLDRKCLQNSFDEFVWQSVRVDNNNSIGVTLLQLLDTADLSGTTALIVPTQCYQGM